MKLYQEVEWPKGSSMGFKILVTPTPRGVRGDFLSKILGGSKMFFYPF
jgi:hypothetical protein